MLAPILTYLTALLAGALTLVPVIGGLALFVAGLYFAFNNHGRAKEGLISAGLGIAVMLGSQTMASAIHP